MACLHEEVEEVVQIDLVSCPKCCPADLSMGVDDNTDKNSKVAMKGCRMKVREMRKGNGGWKMRLTRLNEALADNSNAARPKQD